MCLLGGRLGVALARSRSCPLVSRDWSRLSLVFRFSVSSQSTPRACLTLHSSTSPCSSPCSSFDMSSAGSERMEVRARQGRTQQWLRQLLAPPSPRESHCCRVALACPRRSEARGSVVTHAFAVVALARVLALLTRAEISIHTFTGKQSSRQQQRRRRSCVASSV